MPPSRNCIWILGHGETLLKSNFIWHYLVQDAKNRLCWFSARAHVTIEEATEAHVDDTIVKTTEATEERQDLLMKVGRSQN